MLHPMTLSRKTIYPFAMRFLAALLLTGKGSADPSLPGGPSLATLLGQTLGETAFRSVQLGVQSSVAIDYEIGFKSMILLITRHIA